MTTPEPAAYAARLDIDYPDRDLDRVSSAFRLIYFIPIAIVLGMVSGGTFEWSAGDATLTATTAGGFLFFPALLMILFRLKYPRWWFDWNLELARFSTRVLSYFALMSDGYPSTTDEQNVHLELDYPDVEQDLNRWLPLVKWLLAIPHFIILIFLGIGAFFAVVFAWFAILFTGRYPQGLFRFVEGVFRWGLRVEAYALLLITDEYPPFSLD